MGFTLIYVTLKKRSQACKKLSLVATIAMFGLVGMDCLPLDRELSARLGKPTDDSAVARGVATHGRSKPGQEAWLQGDKDLLSDRLTEPVF